MRQFISPLINSFIYFHIFQVRRTQLVKYPRVRENSNLLTSILGLRFYITSEHMKVICGATHKSNLHYKYVTTFDLALNALILPKFNFVYILFQYANIVKVKCTAILMPVYLKSNEITFEVKRPENAPALESREKKVRGGGGVGGNNSPSGASDFKLHVSGMLAMPVKSSCILLLVSGALCECSLP